MATLKHIPSKNADYGKILEYLMFEHSENGTPVWDEEGNMVMRDQFLLDGINCNPYYFDKECEMLNWQYRKNQKASDVKSHHYIISFDPQDQADGLLTPEHAQKLGKEFAARYFPGHQILVCTHNDGHNKSGNIHVHICFNSLRKLDVEKQPFMERDIDCRAGYKHHPNAKLLQILKEGLMKMCEREGLHQIDLLSPAKARITEEEYRAEMRGLEKLNKLNKEILADHMKPARTTFQTQKQYLRDAILDASRHSNTVDDFKIMLLTEYNIKVKDHRGRFSYLHPDRSKYITGRALGTDYEKETILEKLKSNLQEKQELQADSREDDTSVDDKREWTDYAPSYDYQADPFAILYIHSDLRLVINLQKCVKAQLSEAYTQKVKISNLKEIARTIAFIQEQGIDSREILLERYDNLQKNIESVQTALHDIDKKIRSTNEQIHFAGQYYVTRPVHADFLKAWNKGRFRMRHREELARYNEAVNYFRDKTNSRIPSIRAMKEEKRQLTTSKRNQSEVLQKFYLASQSLQTIITNVDIALSQGHITSNPADIEQENTLQRPRTSVQQVASTLRHPQHGL